MARREGDCGVKMSLPLTIRPVRKRLVDLTRDTVSLDAPMEGRKGRAGRSWHEIHGDPTTPEDLLLAAERAGEELQRLNAERERRVAAQRIRRAEPKRAYSVQEVARRWSVNTKTVYLAIREGHLRSFRVGRLLRVSLSEILRVEQVGRRRTAGARAS